MNRWPISQLRSRFSRHRRALTWSGGAAVILISGLLLSQSFAASFKRYQTYRDSIATLRELESELSQEILRSRYELFASYDGLVTNLAKQETLHQQLNDIPEFLGPGDRRSLTRILQERQTALTQKEDLSEWFKSRNALLKNSLRYLPFLTRQIEASFDTSTPLPSVTDITDAPDPAPEETSARQPLIAGETQSTSPGEAAPFNAAENSSVENGNAPVTQTSEADADLSAPEPEVPEPEAVEPETADESNTETPSADSGVVPEQVPEDLSEPASTAAIASIPLSAEQRETLRSNLNQLIRNLLLYNASSETQIADQAEALVQELAVLENNLEFPQEVLPTKVFRSHTNVILTTKPLVEELTGQLLLPLDQYTDELEATLEHAYQQASRRTSLFRALGLIWFLSLLVMGTRWYIQRSRHHDPAFERYQRDVGDLAATATRLHSDTVLSPEEASLANLLPLLAREDDIGQLARHLQGIGEQHQEMAQAAQEEAFAFLTARLNLLTKNRRKLINAEAAIALRAAVETYLAEHGCSLLDLQLETDQVSISFRYPLSQSLASLVHQLKQATAEALHPLAIAVEPSLSSPDEIWSDAYLIASCPPPDSSTAEALLANQGERQ